MNDPLAVWARIRKIELDEMKNWEKAVVLLFLKKGFHGYMKMTEITRRIYGWYTPNRVFSGQYTNIMRAVKIGEGKRIFDIANNPKRVKLRRTADVRDRIRSIWKRYQGYEIPDWYFNLP